MSQEVECSVEAEQMMPIQLEGTNVKHVSLIFGL